MNPSHQHAAGATPVEGSRPGPRTALVLGGGGSVGNAWLLGVVAGLHDAGLDVTRAGLTIGTSAGSTAAAQLSAAAPSELLSAVLDGVPQRSARPPGSVGGAARARPATHLETTGALIAASQDAADMRRRLGAWALETESATPRSPQWRATVAARLPSQVWPHERLLITAVDAVTGEPVVFDRDSGVDLVDAVAASCAGGFAYRIGDRHYIDGGYRCNADNADLAAGCARVLVLSPFGGRTRTPVAWGLDLASQVDALRASGSIVETVAPDSASLAAFGDDMMDLSARAPAARAGADQGRALAEALTELWH